MFLTQKCDLIKSISIFITVINDCDPYLVKSLFKLNKKVYEGDQPVVHQ